MNQCLIATYTYTSSSTGNIPNDLFMLTNLKQLDLNNNQLSGDIEGIQQLKRLEFLQLHHNKFSGIIPQEISDMTNLRVFTTYGNNFDNAPSSLCMNRDVNGGNLTTYIADCSPICPCCSSMFCGWNEVTFTITWIYSSIALFQNLASIKKYHLI